MSATTNRERGPTISARERAPSIVSAQAKLLRSGATIAGAIAIASLLQALLQVVLARVLAPPDYSALVTLFVIVTICAVPTLGLQAAVARDIATMSADGRYDEAGVLLRRTLRAVARVSAIALVICAAVAAPVAIAFHVQRFGALAAAAVVVLSTAALPVAWGGLQGTGRFGMLAAGQVTWSALRFGLAVALAAVGFGVGGAMAGIALATLGMLVVALAVQRPILTAGRRGGRAAARITTPYTVAAAAALCAFAALTSLDVPTARIAFSGNAAGAYSAASVGARALLIVAIGATTVLFPRVATLDDPRRERRHLRAGLLVVGGVGAVAIAIAAAVPKQLLRIVFGSGYEQASGYLALLVVAVALYGLVYVYTYHFLSLGRLRFAAVLGAVLAAQLGLYAAFHAGGRQLALVQVACAAVLVTLCEGYERTVPR